MSHNENSNKKHISEVLKKTSRKMTLRIVRICILCLSVLVLLISLPYTLQTFQSGRIGDAQKLSMLHYQFSSPLRVVGFGNQLLPPLSVKAPLHLYARTVVGKNPLSGDQQTTEFYYNVLTGKVRIDYPIWPSFMHTIRYKQIEEKYKQELQNQSKTALKVLEKNKDTTVALMDISFPRTYSLEEIADSVRGLDLEVEWLAIETGLEDRHPSERMGMPAQQFFKWGIPAKLYTPESIFDPQTLNLDNPKEYLRKVMEQLNWAKAHSKLLAKSNLDVLGFNTDSVISAADYLQTNGFKCYGLRINGPTDQLLQLAQRQDYLMINIAGIDVWYWDSDK